MTATPTPLGVMVLALLRESDMHPYEMLRLLRQRRGDRMVRLTNGTLYHTVARLQRDGLIAEVGVEREGNRPERTSYALTAAGPGVLEVWVRRELARIDRPADFPVALAEAHNLAREEIVALIQERRAALAAEHDRLAEGLADARRRSVPEQFLVELDRRQALSRTDLAWTDGFLADLAKPDIPWGPDEIPSQSIPTNQALRKAARE